MIPWLVAVAAVCWALGATVYGLDQRKQLGHYWSAFRSREEAWDAERQRLTAAALVPTNPVGASRMQRKAPTDEPAPPRPTPIGL